MGEPPLTDAEIKALRVLLLSTATQRHCMRCHGQIKAYPQLCPKSLGGSFCVGAH